MNQEMPFATIHQLLLERYSLDELRTLCAELAVPFDDLGGEGRQAKAREMILWLNRRGRLTALITRLQTPPEPQTPEPDQSPEVSRQPTRIDLAIVTAMPEELEPILNLIGGRQHWQPLVIDRYIHHQARFDLADGSLNVVACSLWKYGGNPTTAEILRLAALKPRLIAMTGICAGWESKDIRFGDVIVAERAFHAGEGRQTIAGFEADIRTYQPPPWLLQWLGDFASDTAWFKSIGTPRPSSLHYQAEWLLCQVAERGTAFPETTADWSKVKRNYIDYPRARQLLEESEMVSATGELTDRALERLKEIRRRNHGKLVPTRDNANPAVHYGAFASTEAVIAVENPFLAHAVRVRKVRAIELEVASLFAAASEIGVPAFAVKGVSDYGTPDKDDTFHTYAAEASAHWMYHFLQRYGHLLSQVT
ncbi:MAG: hypothetical protein HC822_03875 [Oscillochloris sp.]|nr:hypothetical protein [Oscillochloris sp.]